MEVILTTSTTTNTSPLAVPHPANMISFLFDSRLFFQWTTTITRTNHHHHHYGQALLLAVASSMDNLLVGMSVGLSGKRLPLHVLWGISLCNAAGCWMATSVGSLGDKLWLWFFDFGQKQQMEHNQHCNNSSRRVVQYLLAALAFGYLAFQEYQEQQQQQEPKSDDASKINTNNNHNNKGDTRVVKNKNKPTVVSLQLALPMTLNNLAGGMTGGVLGLPPWLNALFALVISVIFMWLGYLVGSSAWGSTKRSTTTTARRDSENRQHEQTRNMAKVSIALYLLLSAQ